jgi:hypothetical protein
MGFRGSPHGGLPKHPTVLIHWRPIATHLLLEMSQLEDETAFQPPLTKNPCERPFQGGLL